MLTINNIDSLKNETIGDWRIVEAYANKGEDWLKCEHYCITFTRGEKGAAVLIDRRENKLLKGYHVYVCYGNYDNLIHETVWTKENIQRKDLFFGMVLKNINERYYKQNK